VTIPAEIASSLPPLTEARLVLDDPRTQVWRVVVFDGTVVAVKVTRDNESGYGARMAARETEVLQAMGPAVVGPYLRGYGTTAGATWLAVEWVDGPSLHQRWRSLRPDATTERIVAVEAARRGALALALVHEAGWRHGDIRGEHVLGDPPNVRLIDFETAQEPPGLLISIVNPYRGGYPEMLAPEVAAEINSTGENEAVTLLPSAEVFSVGAAILHAWAGRSMYPVPVERYGDLLSAIADGPPSIESIRPWSWPTIESLLAQSMDRNPANRPTARELATALAALAENPH
jgi:serine/threonine protein kinase